MPNLKQLSSFVSWYKKHITGDEKGQAQIFLDCLFQGFGLNGSLDVGGSLEFRVLKFPKGVIFPRRNLNAKRQLSEVQKVSRLLQPLTF